MVCIVNQKRTSFREFDTHRQIQSTGTWNWISESARFIWEGHSRTLKSEASRPISGTRHVALYSVKRHIKTTLSNSVTLP